MSINAGDRQEINYAHSDIIISNNTLLTSHDVETSISNDIEGEIRANESQNNSSSKSENVSACVEVDISSNNVSNDSPLASSSNSKSNVPDETTLDEGDSLPLSESFCHSLKNNDVLDCSSNAVKGDISIQFSDYRKISHSLQFEQTTSDISSSESPPQDRLFFCREWAWTKLLTCLEQRSSAKTCGVLIVGGPGTGKTALCSQLVNPSCVQGRQSALLQSRILAYHFCLGNDASSLSVASFIQSLVVQLSQSAYISGYSTKVAVKDVVQSLDPFFLQSDPDDAFQKAVVFPLLEIENPDKPLILLIDSVDEVSLHSYSDTTRVKSSESHTNSNSVLELLSNHHHLLPHWLLLVITARRGTHTKALARTFAGYRKIALDDLRRSHVIRDVQQYILCRLDTEPALRYQLSRETAEMLNQLHIKSNGCFLYLEKVLDGVVEGWVTLREIRDIPGTLNGLYLWLCQRLYPRKNFQRVLPLLEVILASRSPLSQTEIQEATSTHIPSLSDAEWSKRWTLLRRIMCPYTKEVVVLFHNSFAEWLLDVKHCTQKYLVDVSVGHAMIAMKMSQRASSLSPLEIQTFAYHLARTPIKTPLQSFHLPLWLLMTGTKIFSCFDEMDLKDSLSFKILQEAGAYMKSENELNYEYSDDEDIEKELLIECSDIPNKEIFEEEMEKRIEESTQTDKRVKSALDELIRGECGSLKKEQRSHSSIDRHSEDSKSFNNDALEGSKIDYEYLKEYEGKNNKTNEQKRIKQREDPLYPYLRGGPIDGVDAAGRTLLHTAAHQGDASLVEVLLQRGADYNLSDRGGQSPLNLAARHGHSDVIEILLSYGSDPDHADDDGWTSLRSAAWGGYVHVVDVLLKGGAQVDLADSDGRTALRAAAWGGHEDVVTILLKNGADVNKADSEGRTPLIAAAYMGHCEIVASLLLRNADVNHVDKDGRSALCVTSLVGDIGLLAGDGRLQVATILLEAGAEVDHEDKDGLTPLLVAAFEGHV